MGPWSHFNSPVLSVVNQRAITLPWFAELY